jgi:hypothetical protein
LVAAASVKTSGDGMSVIAFIVQRSLARLE